MNKLIDFSNLGGYPLAQEDLDWLQNSYRGAFSGMASMIGDKVIITGMVENAGNISAGWISIGGELVPFAAGAIGTGAFIVEETKTPLIFEDGNSREVIIERIAHFSDGGGNAYADLVRLEALKNLWQRFDIKQIFCDAAYIAANFNNGLGINLRTGWAICDGNNGTPNLTGKSPVQYDPADGDYDEPGKIGGHKQVTIGMDNLPDITEGGQQLYALKRTGSFTATGMDNDATEPNIHTSFALNFANNPMDTRSPFFTLLFIMKL